MNNLTTIIGTDTIDNTNSSTIQSSIKHIVQHNTIPDKASDEEYKLAYDIVEINDTPNIEPKYKLKLGLTQV
jgi:hypothetical protein